MLDLKQGKYLLGIAIFLVGLLSGFLLSFWSNGSIEKEDIINTKQYTLLNPALDDSRRNFDFKSSKYLYSLENDLKEGVEKWKNDKFITDASIYYRDLINGPWMGINERAEFAPASLIKVPLLMAYYYRAEHDPTILDKKILVTGSYDYSQQIVKPEKELVIGKSYSVSELLDQMIIYSDNFAYNILNENIDVEDIYLVYDNIGIDMREFNEENPSGNIIKVNEYSSLFRTLYNASFLNKEYSQKVLDILSQTRYGEGLNFFLPKDLVVAHKFGERNNLDNNEQQLHDCGIIYSSNPYILCVMTKGFDREKMSLFIAQTSQLIYQFELTRGK